MENRLHEANPELKRLDDWLQSIFSNGGIDDGDNNNGDDEANEVASGLSINSDGIDDNNGPILETKETRQQDNESFEHGCGENNKPKEKVDTILAQNMTKLSLQDREMAYEEIHGVGRVEDETPESVAEQLDAMDQHLRKISPKDAYDEAYKICPEYVEGRKLRLMFLRAEYFDAKKAAIRLVKFMEGKLELFGKNCLARPLQISDLDKDALAFFKKGFLQILPVRDRTGRAVFIDLMGSQPRAYDSYLDVVSSICYI